MKTKKPNYTTRKVADGKRFELTLYDKGADGRVRSVSCEYPLYLQIVNEKGEFDMVKQTKKQTENYLLKMLGC